MLCSEYENELLPPLSALATEKKKAGENRPVRKAAQCDVELIEFITIHELSHWRPRPQNSSSSVTVFLYSKDG